MGENCIHLIVVYDMSPELICDLDEDCHCEECPYYFSKIDYEAEMADRAYEDYIYGGN